MGNNIEFDERQIWIRGEAFKHGLLLMGALLLLDAFLRSAIITTEEVTLAEGMWGNILIIVLTVTICEIELILRGAVDFDNNSNKILMIFFTLIGGYLLIMGIIHFFSSDYNLLTSNSLSEHGARLLMSVCWLSIGIIGMIKHRRIKYDE